MSEIAPIGGPAAANLTRAIASTHAKAPSVGAPRHSDRAEFSRAAQLLSRIAELPDIRQDLVDRVRAEIAAGTYDTPEKIDGLLDELAEDLGAGD